MKAFKKFQHCGDTYYVGINSPVTPNCSECGEKIPELSRVEVYEDHVKQSTEPVKTFDTVEEYEEQ